MKFSTRASSANVHSRRIAELLGQRIYRCGFKHGLLE
jgi:hypothetical protein